MKIAIIIIAGYLVCCVAAWWLFTDAWRNEHDVTQSDNRFFIVMSSLGPASLCAAGIIWLVEQPKAHSDVERVVFKRKDAA